MLVDAAPAEGFSCQACGRRFPMRDGQLTCMPSEGVRAVVEVTVRQADPVWPRWSAPPGDAYRGPLSERTNPRHLGILAARAAPLDTLDWGCGAAEYRAPITALGHRYLGLDAAGRAADVLADVHRLPFRAASFDHTITAAVLEHVANPLLALREVARVLRPGGVFSGSVAFLEPWHAHSHFHLAPDGLVHAIGAAGLRLDGLWPQEGWTVYDSLAAMPGPVSGPTRFVLRRLARLERLVRARRLHPRELFAGRWLRRRTRAELEVDLLTIAGQIDFLAVKV